MHFSTLSTGSRYTSSLRNSHKKSPQDWGPVTSVARIPVLPYRSTTVEICNQVPGELLRCNEVVPRHVVSVSGNTYGPTKCPKYRTTRSCSIVPEVLWNVLHVNYLDANGVEPIVVQDCQYKGKSHTEAPSSNKIKVDPQRASIWLPSANYTLPRHNMPRFSCSLIQSSDDIGCWVTTDHDISLSVQPGCGIRITTTLAKCAVHVAVFLCGIFHAAACSFALFGCCELTISGGTTPQRTYAPYKAIHGRTGRDDSYVRRDGNSASFPPSTYCNSARRRGLHQNFNIRIIIVIIKTSALHTAQVQAFPCVGPPLNRVIDEKLLHLSAPPVRGIRSLGNCNLFPSSGRDKGFYFMTDICIAMANVRKSPSCDIVDSTDQANQSIRQTRSISQHYQLYQTTNKENRSYLIAILTDQANQLYRPVIPTGEPNAKTNRSDKLTINTYLQVHSQATHKINHQNQPDNTSQSYQLAIRTDQANCPNKFRARRPGARAHTIEIARTRKCPQAMIMRHLLATRTEGTHTDIVAVHQHGTVVKEEARRLRVDSSGEKSARVWHRPNSNPNLCGILGLEFLGIIIVINDLEEAGYTSKIKDHVRNYAYASVLISRSELDCAHHSHKQQISDALYNEVLRGDENEAKYGADSGIQWRGKREIPEKTRRSAASSGTIPTCENPGLLPMRTGFNPRPGHSRIFASAKRARRCRWSADFLGDLTFPPPLNSAIAPFSPHFILIGSQELVVKSRPNLSTQLNYS
ncbi:hypothetical protein PR048_023341 [Dryococelus australis]|uniref:Uncharacterized protein n=1 Tax=Dryococelus australis TaxID=614101 RepID=A0ABQ9GTU1_9NEOP|nr:hypothetical protein PR048_023341 [Dryococelus australis]